MHLPKLLSESLRLNLLGVLANRYAERQLNELVAVCHALASAFVQSKCAAGKLNLSQLGLSSRDVAYDCVADLFQRDDAGTIIQLKVYFDGLLLEELSDQALLAHLRRLVFSKVNQGIFRLYNESDPALGKILRNIKLAIQALGNFVEIERFGEVYVAPSYCDPLIFLSSLDGEGLERVLRELLSGNERTPEILAKISHFLREQEENSRAIHLVTLAVAIRTVLAGERDVRVEYSSVEEKLHVDDVRTIIHQTCEELKQITREKYVHRKKITVEVFESYFNVIEARLCELFVQRNGDAFSLFEQLRQAHPSLTRNEYRRRHKNVLEYLSRQAQERALRQLRKM